MAVKKTSTKSKSSARSKKKVVPTSLKPIGSKQTKNEILKTIAEHTELSTRQVKEVFIATSSLLKAHLVKRGSGEFAIPELGIKVVRKVKPATKKRQGRNPLTGESITIPAKPKREVIRIKPLKTLKECIE